MREAVKRTGTIERGFDVSAAMRANCATTAGS